MGTPFLTLTLTPLPPPRFSINPRLYVHQTPTSPPLSRFSYHPCLSPPAARPRRYSDPDADELFESSSMFDFSIDGDDKFRSGSRQKRRNWWSDDDDDDDDDSDEEDDLFGSLGGPSATDLVFKIFGAFAWMVPIVLISAVMDTGQNPLIMALILPLGQSTIALVVDKLWGSSEYTPNPRPMRKRKPFAETANKRKAGDRTSKGSDTSIQDMVTYQPGSAADAASSSSSVSSSGLNFGGWDDLVNQAEYSRTFRRRRPIEDEDSEPVVTPRRRRRKRGKTSLLRQLVSVFPFFGPWTRLFF